MLDAISEREGELIHDAFETMREFAKQENLTCVEMLGIFKLACEAYWQMGVANWLGDRDDDEGEEWKA